MYPESEEMVAYGEFRNSFEKNTEDARMVFVGMRHIIENFVAVKWTENDVQMADTFYRYDTTFLLLESLLGKLHFPTTKLHVADIAQRTS